MTHDPKGAGAGSEVSSPIVTPVLVAELLAEGERMPVYVHVIDHPDARVLVDTGMTSCTRRWPTWIHA